MITLDHLANVLLLFTLASISETSTSFECEKDQIDDDMHCHGVSTILAPPYVMLANHNGTNSTLATANNDNDGVEKNGTESDNSLNNEPQFKGFLVDYLNELARLADFRYHLRLVKDGRYGYRVDRLNMLLNQPIWNGLIGELIRNETDIALAPLTFTPEREQFVDFTVPFEFFQAVIVFWKRPTRDTSHIPPITSIENLANRTDYRYGVKRDGAIYKYLKQFKNDEFRENILKILNKNPLQPLTNEAGLARVQQDLSYAFIVEESAVRAALRQPLCHLQSVPTNFYKRFYSLAVRKRSTLRERLNAAHVEMVDSGSFDRLVIKWWGVDLCSAGTALQFGSCSILMITVKVAFMAMMTLFGNWIL